MFTSQLVFSQATTVPAPRVPMVCRVVPAAGGALDNSGTLTADLCDFIGNSAVGAAGLSDSDPYHYGASGGSGGDGDGGAIGNFGTMTIIRSTFTNNSAVGGAGANGLWDITETRGRAVYREVPEARAAWAKAARSTTAAPCE